GSLAPAGGPHEDEELFVLDLQRQVIDREDVSELLRHVIERDRGHSYPPACVSGQSMSPTVGLEARERGSRTASLGRSAIGTRMDRVAPRDRGAGDEATQDADAVRDRARRRSEIDDDPAILTDADERRILGRELARPRVAARVVGDSDEGLGDIGIVDRKGEPQRTGPAQRLEPALDAPGPSARDAEDEP